MMKARHGLPVGPAGSQAARRGASSAAQLAGWQQRSAGLGSAAAMAAATTTVTATATTTAREG